MKMLKQAFRYSAMRIGLAMTLTTALAACAGTSAPQMAALSGALVTTIAENYGGKYYAEATGFLADLQQASQQAAMQQISLARFNQNLVPGGEGLAETNSMDDMDNIGDGMSQEDAMGGSMDGAMDDSMAGGMTTMDLDAYGFDVEAQQEQVLELQVALMKRVVENGQERIIAIENGDVLVGNPSDPEAGDQFQIFFRPNLDAYIYVVAMDATGWAQPIFPSAFPDRQNPVPAGATALIPEAGYWFGLDEYVGTQHIYFVASPNPRPDLESRMATFASMERPMVESPAQVGVPMVVEEAFVKERGLVGIRPGMATTYAPEAKTEVFSFGVPGADLVVTRYFEHR